MTEDEIRKIVSIPGQVRGQTMVADFNYISDKMGQDGATKLKEKIKEWGSLFDYQSLRVMEWYPIGWRVLSLLAIKEAFDWTDDQIFELGNNAPKYSTIVKLLMKYFLTPQKTFQESSKYWRKHYSVGEMGCSEYDDKKKEGVIYLKDFKVHPILCVYYKGFFLRISQYVLKGKNVRVKETSCPFSQGDYHEFVINW